MSRVLTESKRMAVGLPSVDPRRAVMAMPIPVRSVGFATERIRPSAVGAVPVENRVIASTKKTQSRSIPSAVYSFSRIRAGKLVVTTMTAFPA